MQAWQFWIDRGGTFTDVIGLAPDGRLHVRKELSRQAETAAAEDAGILGIRRILQSEIGARDRFEGCIQTVKVGTTVATNALLERQGAEVLLVTTAGHADALAIGYQNRPDIFARHIVLAQRLYTQVIEATERLDERGVVLTALDEASLEAQLRGAHARGVRSVAIAFLHGWQHPQHERQAAALARRIGFEDVSVSHELSPLVRFIARADTTVLNAYLAPPLRAYLEGLAAQLRALDPGARLELMQSNGGLAALERFRALASVLSGPAGGLIGMAWIGARAGVERLIGFDMGGTSTDVSLLDGELPRRFEHLIAGVRLQQTMLDVHTIAAGGGSILAVRDGRLAVGPASAGSVPGPASYGRGGPLTLTDVQVLLGRLRADTLPALFGADGRSSIDRACVAAQFAALRASMPDGVQRSAEALAGAFLDVAVESMANAIRQVSTRQGLDAAEFTLFCFGGAAGQHACRVAAAAGMHRVLVHPLASVLSAFGIGVADRLAVRRASLRLPLDAAALDAAGRRLGELERAARHELAPYGPTEAAQAVHLLEVRAGDSDTTFSLPLATQQAVRAAFDAEHLRRFGFEAAALEIIIEAVRVEVRMGSLVPGQLRMPEQRLGTALPPRAPVWFDGQWREVPLASADGPADTLEGPALIVAPHSTVVLEPGWHAQRRPDGQWVLERASAAAAPPDTHGGHEATADPARIEIFNNLYMHIAEQMGEVLKATAQSVNIKERLDYSCALFDARGGLIANAPHMPVHLGSMGSSVRAVIEARRGALRRGDAWLLNSPYHGGTHLPDMTVVTPVFLSGADEPDCFVASRAHHADIGGTTPGSMPPFSRTIEEEGVLLECFQLLDGGRLREGELRAALAAARYPARRPNQNVADLRAQLAANARGIAEIERAVARHGLGRVRDYMAHVQANAAECIRAAIAQLRSGSFEYELDDGARIAVSVRIEDGRAHIDFTGTSAAHSGNFNAPRAVCVAAVVYVFRTLIERPIPLNEGCLEPLVIRIPAGSLLDPVYPAAVAAGNVETSQCIVDALYGALGVLAASQGTMNNLTFGDAHVQYYETIAGGAGAGADFDGCDAVQTHMTNSRLTDPEILEMRFPVLLREFAIRRGSGGSGRHRGGDGVLRRLEFRAPLTGALLANHHRVRPFGLQGAGSGAAGAGQLRRADGSLEPIGATASFTVGAADELTILTPGGGGFGAP
ncbi:MAG: hydantoinase B/oxoprolinase family protein [Steroidobacteraceae bacterium]